MSLTTYITPLLYRHQCVVVPGFGAFLTHNISAVFSPKTHTFYPPSKAISFNEQIKIGDGLLATYVASCQGVSYDEAMKFVAQSVSEWETALAQGSSLDLAELGHISVSKNGKIQFESYKTTNYLSAAFGLSAVQSDPLAAKAADLPVMAQSIEAPEKPVVSMRPWMQYAAVGMIAIATSLGVYQNNTYRQNLAWAQKEAGIALEREIHEATFFYQNPTTLPALSLTAEVSKDAESPARVYHVVAGAFKMEENAAKKLDQLRAQGYEDAAIIGQNRFGLHQVVFGAYPQENSARALLDQVKKLGAKDAWLLVQTP